MFHMKTRLLCCSLVFAAALAQAIAAVEGGMMLDTAFGRLAGASLGESISVGQPASLAVPAEAIDVLPLSTWLTKYLAASLAYLMTFQHDAAGLITFDTNGGTPSFAATSNTMS